MNQVRPGELEVVPQVFLTQHHLAIAMEYAAGGNLYQLVAKSGGLPEQDARWYFQQLIFAIDYCHKMVQPRGPRVQLWCFALTGCLHL